MNQFAKYSTDESKNDQSAPKETPQASGDLLHNLHNDIIALAQSVADLKDELSAVKKNQTELDERLTTQYTAVPEQAPQSESPTEEAIIEEQHQEPIVTSETEPVQLTSTEAEKALGMSDDEIQSLLASAAQESISESQMSEEPDVEEEPAEEIAQKEVAHEDWPVVPMFSEPVQDTLRTLPALSFEVSMDAIKSVPAHLAIGSMAVPTVIEDKRLICKSVEPFDYAALDLIADHTGLKIVPEAAPIAEVVCALRKHYGPQAYEVEREAVAEVAATPKRSMFKRRSA